MLFKITESFERSSVVSYYYSLSEERVQQVHPYPGNEETFAGVCKQKKIKRIFENNFFFTSNMYILLSN